MRSPIYLLQEELFEIAVWKSGGRSKRHLTADNETVLEVSKEAFLYQNKKDIIETLIRGLSGVGIPIASAIMHFVWPDQFGAVDWRNWYVLSHLRSDQGVDNKLFNNSLLPKLSSPKSSAGIGTQEYLSYLKVLQKLAKTHSARIERSSPLLITHELQKEFDKMTPAEVDMAIFSYSQRFAKKF